MITHSETSVESGQYQIQSHQIAKEIMTSNLQNGFTQCPISILNDHTLSNTAKRVYQKLLFYWSISLSNGKPACWPAQATLANDLNVSRRTIIRATNELRRRWYVDVWRVGLGDPNYYFMNPLEFADNDYVQKCLALQVEDELVAADPLQVEDELVAADPLQVEDELVAADPLQVEDELVAADPLQVEDELVAADPLQVEDELVAADPLQVEDELVAMRPIPPWIVEIMTDYSRDLNDKKRSYRGNQTRLAKIHYWLSDYAGYGQWPVEDQQEMLKTYLIEAKKQALATPNIQYWNNGRPNRMPTFWHYLEELMELQQEELEYLRSDRPLYPPPN